MICACVLTIFEFNLRSSSWSTLIFAPWLILMHNYMYMAFIPNPFNILLASPMEQTFLYNLMSLFLHRNCHSLSSLNAYIDVDGFHPPIHPIFFMHCKWNFPSNVYLSASISPLGLSFNYQNHTWGLHVLLETPVEHLYNHPVTLWRLVHPKHSYGIRELHNLMVIGTCISHEESNSNILNDQVLS